MPEKNLLDQEGLSLADLENSHNEVLSRIARQLAESGSGTPNAHSSHSSSSGSGHSSYVSATGPSKEQAEQKPRV
jgi:hypothetical protein